VARTRSPIFETVERLGPIGGKRCQRLSWPRMAGLGERDQARAGLTVDRVLIARGVGFWMRIFIHFALVAILLMGA